MLADLLVCCRRPSDSTSSVGAARLGEGEGDRVRALGGRASEGCCWLRAGSEGFWEKSELPRCVGLRSGWTNVDQNDEAGCSAAGGGMTQSSDRICQSGARLESCRESKRREGTELVGRGGLSGGGARRKDRKKSERTFASQGPTRDRGV